MKFTIEIDPEVNPNAVGEYLRSAFFDEKVHKAGTQHFPYGTLEEDLRETGCYNTFDWQEDVEPLEDIVQEDFTCEGCQKPDPSAGHQGGLTSMDYVCTCIEAERWTRGRKKIGDTAFSVEIECRYYWDGDGELIFTLPDGSILVNDDCKKDHGWNLYSSREEYEGGT